VLETLFASLNPPEASWILVLEDKCSRRVDEGLLDAVRPGLATVPRCNDPLISCSGHTFERRTSWV